MKNKKDLVLISFILLIAAILRFYNLMHDSPYFFNPDERNMASAITRFRLPNKPSHIPICLISQFFPSQLDANSCTLNPRFFAYGQFPLYLAYISDQATKPLINLFINHANQPTTGNQSLTTNFPSAIFWLRFYSALSSTFTVLLVYLITKEITNKSQASSTKSQTNHKHQAPNHKQIGVFGTFEFRISNLFRISDFGFGIYAAILAAFSPGLIQSAHFGTTESLLTFFFLASVYLSFKFIEKPVILNTGRFLIHNSKFIILNSFFIGLALGSKLTGAFFLIPPFLSTIIHTIININKILRKRRVKWSLKLLRLYREINNYSLVFLLIVIGSLFFAVISSPFNLIEKQDFLGAVFGYERDVAVGKYDVFYTRQFVNTAPIIFQAKKIFPYALGWPVFILGTLGFLLITIQLIIMIIQSITSKISKIKYKKSKIQLKIQKLLTNTLNLKRGGASSGSPKIGVPLWVILGLASDRTPKLKYERLEGKKLQIVLLFSFLIYFLPNAFLFAKWTRFMTPIFSFFAIFAGYFLKQAQSSKLKAQSYSSKLKTFRKLGYWMIGLLVFISLLPGAAFMSIYTHEDSRVTASRWIYKNIPDNSYVLSETANVVDIPLSLTGDAREGLPARAAARFAFLQSGRARDGRAERQDPSSMNYQVISFDFYHLDEKTSLFNQLLTHLEKADYIFIPSRRIFANHPRLVDKFPLVTKYHQLLFSGALGFEKTIEISSFPIIGPLKFPDEQAEETFTVFDHPVIRIYRKTKQLTEDEYRLLFKK